MKSHLGFLAMICLLTLGTSCRFANHRTESSPRRADDVAAVQRLIADWRAGWRENDAAAILALYADDAVLMPQSQPALVGKEAIRPVYQSVFEEYHVEGFGETLDLEVAGDWGFLRCTYTLTATPKDGGAQLEDEGKCVFIVRRQPDGAWRVARLIANSDRPPPDDHESAAGD